MLSALAIWAELRGGGGGEKNMKKKNPKPKHHHCLQEARKAFQKEGKEEDSPVPGEGALASRSPGLRSPTRTRAALGAPAPSRALPNPVLHPCLSRTAAHSSSPIRQVFGLLFYFFFLFPLLSPGSMLRLSCLT